MPDVDVNTSKWFQTSPEPVPEVGPAPPPPDTPPAPNPVTGRRQAIVAIGLALGVAAGGGAALRMLQRGETRAEATPGAAPASAPASAPARLDVTGDATRTVVRTADLGARRYQTAADATESGGVVRMRGGGEIVLSAAVPWQVGIAGATTTLDLDFRAGGLAGLELTGGATRVDLTLPAPRGTVPLRLTGGASEVRLHVPPDVPVRARLGAGADRATLDATDVRTVKPGTRFTPRNFAAAQDRYDLDATAKVSVFRLDRT